MSEDFALIDWRIFWSRRTTRTRLLHSKCFCFLSLFFQQKKLCLGRWRIWREEFEILGWHISLEGLIILICTMHVVDISWAIGRFGRFIFELKGKNGLTVEIFSPSISSSQVFFRVNHLSYWLWELFVVIGREDDSWWLGGVTWYIYTYVCVWWRRIMVRGKTGRVQEHLCSVCVLPDFLTVWNIIRGFGVSHIYTPCTLARRRRVWRSSRKLENLFRSDAFQVLCALRNPPSQRVRGYVATLTDG